MTPRQHQLLTFIGDFTNANGYPPTYAEMIAAIGIKSKSGIHRILSGLREQGKLGWTPTRRHSVVIAPEPTADNLRAMVDRLAKEEGPERAAAALIDMAASLVPAMGR